MMMVKNGRQYLELSLLCVQFNQECVARNQKASGGFSHSGLLRLYLNVWEQQQKGRNQIHFKHRLNQQKYNLDCFMVIRIGLKADSTHKKTLFLSFYISRSPENNHVQKQVQRMVGIYINNHDCLVDLCVYITFRQYGKFMYGS